MPILWLFVRFLRKAGGFAGPPALQWVYSILAFCRGQGKRRAPAVQTLYVIAGRGGGVQETSIRPFGQWELLSIHNISSVASEPERAAEARSAVVAS